MKSLPPRRIAFLRPLRRAASGALASLLALAAIGAGGCRAPQQTFETPEAAVDALVEALRPTLDRSKLESVLGPDARAKLPSGDSVADAADVAEFLRRFDQGHRLVAGPEDSVVLELGSDRWPFAFPLSERDGRWAFDTEAGVEELANRRIGRNELSTIQTMLAIVDAQREYAWTDGDRDGYRQYAARFISEPGARNGLFWPTEAGERPSPLGDLIARATEEGYRKDGEGVYHGYRFRMLTAQGPGAPGGAMNYAVDGRLIGGFAVVAWPAEYDVSGIMTFIVNQDGVVYQKDLGPQTERIARAMQAYDPSGWSWAQSN
ncbi:MAG TPA: DUF2950 domain-containing protein [Phycisphaerales bacterium]|nr:DUF2950 domain-containing protein [Phycisphaerales bacterium]HMP38408.1 DUF2950 domain-containing protein [Phycisphaerales bacterium]